MERMASHIPPPEGVKKILTQEQINVDCTKCKNKYMIMDCCILSWNEFNNLTEDKYLTKEQIMNLCLNCGKDKGDIELICHCSAACWNEQEGNKDSDCLTEEQILKMEADEEDDMEKLEQQFIENGIFEEHGALCFEDAADRMERLGDEEARAKAED